MRIGIITGNPADDLTSQDLLEAAEGQAHAEIIDPLRFSIHINSDSDIYLGTRPSSAFDALIIRRLNPFGQTDFQFEAFELLEQQGIRIVNTPRALQIAESKSMTSYILHKNGLKVPSSIVVQQLSAADGFLERHTDIVAKPLYGFQGYDVIRVQAEQPDARPQLDELLREHKCICLQQFIENPGSDIRAFVVGDEVVAAIRRNAEPGQWKTNVHAGGIVEPYEITEAQREAAIKAAKVLGLDYTGVDIIEGPDGDYILEANGSPAWGGVLLATGRNVARDIISHVVQRTGEDAARKHA